MEHVLAKLDMKTVKLSGFQVNSCSLVEVALWGSFLCQNKTLFMQETLKVRAAEAKMPFPTRWDIRV